MDLTRNQSNLSLDFSSQPDDSNRPTPLQLFDQQSGNPKAESIKEEESEDDENDVKFSILGYPLCIKRQKRAGSSSSCSSSSKRQELKSPFDYCDIVTSTTHKSLRGPRGGIIFFRRGKITKKHGFSLCQSNESDLYDFEDKINFSVFPSLQGGPHNNHIAALAVTLKQVATPEYKAYMQQVKKNAQALASALLKRKCRLVTGGTDNHQILWDLRTFGLTGKTFEKVCEACCISLNKTPIFGENGVISPGGVRIGTPAMTTRGCLEADFETIAEFLLRAVQIACALQREYGKYQKDFSNTIQNSKDITELRNRVELFTSQFAMPGSEL